MSAAKAERIFAALGEPTRLMLVVKLAGGARLSITSLSADSPISRQALTKHLRVLEASGLVTSSREGREQLFELRPAALREATDFIAGIERIWDERLACLKDFVEKP